MWLLPSSPSVPATQDSSSQYTSPAPDHEWWLTLSGKPTQRPSSWRGWRTRPWSRLLFGAETSPTWTPRCSEVSGWSPPGSPASRGAQPVKALGFDDERWIWPDLARIVRDVGPRLVFLENVPGLLVRGGLGAVLGDLAEMGFDAEWGVLSAADAGATQLRERVYVLAHAVRSGDRAQPRGVHGDALRRSRSLNGHEPDCGGEALADSDDSGLSRPPVRVQRRRPDEEGGDAGGNGAALVHANDSGQPHERPKRVRPEDVGPEGAGRVVAYANGQAGRSTAGDGESCAGSSPAERTGPAESGRCRSPVLGIFPPGPDDLRAWAEVLAVDPSLEPSLRRVADGPSGGVDGYDDPTRTDQLRALGNGVVPLAGALALRLLAERAGVTL